MAANRKPGNPWNQFAKKPPAGKLARRTPKPEVTPSKALKPAAERKALPPAKNSLPAAGQSGGSKPPRNTTVPQRGGPPRTAEQLSQERRSAAASKRAAATIRSNTPSRPASTGTPVGAATAAETRGGNFVRALRGTARRASQVAGAAIPGATAYLDARKRGERQGVAATQGFSAAAGFASGAAAGARIPGPPIVKGAASLIGGSLGAYGAVKATQGVQEAAKAAERQYSGKPTTVNKGKNRVQGVEGTGRYVSGDMQTDWRSSKPKPRPAPTQSGSASTPSRGSSSSGSGGSSTSSRRQASAALAPMPKAVVNAPKPFNPGRGTSRTDNPLIKNDSYLMGKINQREQASADAAVAAGKASKAEYNVSQDEGTKRLKIGEAKANFDKLSPKEKERVRRRYGY